MLFLLEQNTSVGRSSYSIQLASMPSPIYSIVVTSFPFIAIKLLDEEDRTPLFTKLCSRMFHRLRHQTFLKVRNCALFLVTKHSSHCLKLPPFLSHVVHLMALFSPQFQSHEDVHLFTHKLACTSQLKSQKKF